MKMVRWVHVIWLFGLIACTRQDDLVVSKPSATGSEWRKITSKRGGFTVLMPGTPKAETNVVPTELGNFVAYSVTVEPTGTIAYSVWVYDLPPRALESDWPRALSNIQATMLREGKLIAEKPIALGAHAGKELVFEKFYGQARVTARIYRVNERVCGAYAVMPNRFFVSPKNPDTPREATALLNCFFDSLEFH